MLKSTKHWGLCYILIGGESRYYWRIDHDHRWILDGDEVPMLSNQKIKCPKSMLTGVWSLLGFCVVEMIPNVISCNITYFSNNIFSTIAESRLAETTKDQKWFMLRHFDNPNPHLDRRTIYFVRNNRLILILYLAFPHRSNQGRHLPIW
jgi:hypothetical protein